MPRTRNILNNGPDAGFSGCDMWRIYTNVSYVPGLSDHPRCKNCVEQALSGSMDVSYGQPDLAALFSNNLTKSVVEGIANIATNFMKSQGYKGTAANTPVFQQLWRYIFAEGSYRNWAWTVKTEVDVVFAASFMRSYLLGTSSHYPDEVVAWNGKHKDVAGNSIHGPVEALTSSAITKFSSRREECDQIYDAHPGDGEDLWIFHCMEKIGVQGKRMPNLLSDDGSNSAPWNMAGNKWNQVRPQF